MRIFFLTAAAAVLACPFVSGLALAQNPADAGAAGSAIEEITVTAARINVKPAVSVAGWPRAPVKEITLSYGISTAAFDLTTTAGATDLEKVVNDTAMDVCKEIGRQYPESTPNDAGCAKAAAQKAMVKVHALVAAAAKKGAR
jgi:hypothetical protein